MVPRLRWLFSPFFGQQVNTVDRTPLFFPFPSQSELCALSFPPPSPPLFFILPAFRPDGLSPRISSSSPVVVASFRRSHYFPPSVVASFWWVPVGGGPCLLEVTNHITIFFFPFFVNSQFVRGTVAFFYPVFTCAGIKSLSLFLPLSRLKES